MRVIAVDLDRLGGYIGHRRTSGSYLRIVAAWGGRQQLGAVASTLHRIELEFDPTLALPSIGRQMVGAANESGNVIVQFLQRGLVSINHVARLIELVLDVVLKL